MTNVLATWERLRFKPRDLVTELWKGIGNVPKLPPKLTWEQWRTVRASWLLQAPSSPIRSKSTVGSHQGCWSPPPCIRRSVLVGQTLNWFLQARVGDAATGAELIGSQWAGWDPVRGEAGIGVTSWSCWLWYRMQLLLEIYSEMLSITGDRRKEPVVSAWKVSQCCISSTVAVTSFFNLPPSGWSCTSGLHRVTPGPFASHSVSPVQTLDAHTELSWRSLS